MQTRKERYKNYFKNKKEKHKVRTFESKYFSQEHLEEFREWIDRPHDDDKVKLLIAGTGSGKTYTTVNELVRMKKKVIFCVPNIGTAIELAHSDDYDAVACYGDYNIIESARNDDLKKGKVIFMTYKQIVNLPKVKEVYKDYYLIIDEAHVLTISHGINKSSISALTQMSVEGGYYNNILYISATPDPVILTFGRENMDILEFRKKAPELRYNMYNVIVPKDSSLIEIGHWLLNKISAKNEKALVLSPTDKTLNKVLGERHDAVVIDADSKKKCPVFESIVKTKLIPDTHRFTIMTDLISSGLNLMNEDINNVVILGTYDQTLIRQFPARLRKAKKVNVFIVDRFSHNGFISVTRHEVYEDAVETVERLNGMRLDNAEFNRKLEGEEHVLAVKHKDLSYDEIIFDVNDYSIGAYMWSQYSKEHMLEVAMFYPEGEYRLNSFIGQEDNDSKSLKEEMKMIKEDRKVRIEAEREELYMLVNEYEDPFGKGFDLEGMKENEDLTERQITFLEDINRKANLYPELDLLTVAKLVLDGDYESEIRFAFYRKHLNSAKTKVNSVLQKVLDINVGEDVSYEHPAFEGLKSSTDKKKVLLAIWNVAQISERPYVVRTINKKPKIDERGLSKEEIERLEHTYIDKPKKEVSAMGEWIKKYIGG